jgi:hypothetical protein
MNLSRPRYCPSLGESSRLIALKTSMQGMNSVWFFLCYAASPTAHPCSYVRNPDVLVLAFPLSILPVADTGRAPSSPWLNATNRIGAMFFTVALGLTFNCTGRVVIGTWQSRKGICRRPQTLSGMKAFLRENERCFYGASLNPLLL